MADVLPPERKAEVIAATPMRRIGKPEELAALIRFLLSEESSYMTGQSIVASGGRLMMS
jgi:3-oxoacyl-[acyl-carrier protein] reductase